MLGDTIDFASSFEVALEIGPGVPDALDRFLTVAYFLSVNRRLSSARKDTR